MVMVESGGTTRCATRCAWSGDKDYYIEYHDKEWGVPVHDDRHHFEMLCLEGAQAGLSWDTILQKRAHYKKLFCNFDPVKVSKLKDSQLEKFLLDPGIVRNRLKVFSVRQNAKVFLEIQKEFGSFDKYIWAFVDAKPIKNKWKYYKEMPASTPISDAISKDLKKRGMKFVGSTIMYAYMQAVGLVNDHVRDCFCYN